MPNSSGLIRHGVSFAAALSLTLATVQVQAKIQEPESLLTRTQPAHALLQFRDAAGEVETPLSFGGKDELRQYYSKVPTDQLVGAVNTLLEDLAAIHRGNAAMPYGAPIPNADNCAPSPDGRLFDPPTQKRLLGMARIFENLTISSSVGVLPTSSKARERALGVLSALGAFLPEKIDLSDGNTLRNGQALAADGILPVLTTKDYYQQIPGNVRAVLTGQIIGHVQQTSDTTYQAGVLPGRTVEETRRRLEALGNETRDYLDKHGQLPPALIFTKGNDGAVTAFSITLVGGSPRVMVLPPTLKCKEKPDRVNPSRPQRASGQSPN